MSASEIRESLLSEDHPDGEATYFDASDVADQGIPGGPGYEITVYGDYGRIGVVLPKRVSGGYSIIDVDDLELPPGHHLYPATVHQVLAVRGPALPSRDAGLKGKDELDP